MTMKKFIAIALIAVIALGLVACGAVNDAEVSILWSGDGQVKVPNSLINAMERAMYIENIFYKHYGANGDQAAQTKQAEDALNAGCAALVVELVDASAAQAIVDAAKAKNVPVIFINRDVDSAVVSSYEKCVTVQTAAASLSKVQGELIASALINEKKGTYEKGVDRNGDGKVSYAASGDVTLTVEVVNAALASLGLPALEAVEGTLDTIIGTFTEDVVAAELIITADDTSAQTALVALQAKGYNKDRLKTHCIPMFTVGDTADYKALVLAGRPEGAHKDDNVQSYFMSMQHILDLRTVEESDLASLLYTTGNVIGDGRIAGSAIVDYDNIAVSAADALATLLTGASVASQVIQIDYTTI